MANTTKQWLADTRATEQENARRQREHTAPQPAQSADPAAPPLEVAALDPRDHAVKDLEPVVASQKR